MHVSVHNRLIALQQEAAVLFVFEKVGGWWKWRVAESEF
jgi:hypothetical protein